MSEHDDLIKRVQPYYNDLPVEGMKVLDELVNALTEARAALIVAEDILSRAPFSTGILPNGMHPMTVISQIRKAISLTGEEGNSK
jgi:hypothetical protein